MKVVELSEGRLSFLASGVTMERLQEVGELTEIWQRNFRKIKTTILTELGEDVCGWLDDSCFMSDSVGGLVFSTDARD